MKSRIMLAAIHQKLSNVFFCPEHFLNLTDLSPSGPARRFAESDLGLNC